METITRNVNELAPAQRAALEGVIGHSLHDTERIVLTVENIAPPLALPDGIPDHWRVYEGLNDAEIEDISSAIVRCNLSRSFE